MKRSILTVAVILLSVLSLNAQVEDYAGMKKAPDAQGTGAYQVVIVSEASLPYFTIYRPENLGDAVSKEGRLPVLLFGNGGCATSSKGYEPFLTEIASHGYIAIAIGPIDGSGLPPKKQAQHYTTTGPIGTPGNQNFASLGADDDLLEAASWIIKQNGNEDGDYYHCVDINKLATAGHSCGGAQALAASYDPRIKTTMMMNAGMGQVKMAGASKSDLNELHGPILYFVGGEEDMAYANAVQDYDVIPKNIPVFMVNYPPFGHGGTYGQTNGGVCGLVALNWLDWQFKGKQQAEDFFKAREAEKLVEKLEVRIR